MIAEDTTTEEKTEAPPALRVEDLTVELDTREGGRVELIRNVSLSVGAGESVGLVGESGSGKSMTLRSVLRMLPDGARIARGSIRVAGREVVTLSRDELRALRTTRIGYVPQDPLASLNPCLTVGEQVTTPERLSRIERRRLSAVGEIARGYGVRPHRRLWDRKAAELLEAVSIPLAAERARDYPHQFSGGMRQRALIAAATSMRPGLVLADEPTTALDASVERQVLDLLRHEIVVSGSALLLVTHDLGVVSWYCDRVYVMFQGEVVESGPVEELFTRPQHPYTRRLIAASRRDISALPSTEDVG